MPYIKQADRARLALSKETPATVGELNYKISTILTTFVQRKGLSYQTINDIMGVLSSAQAEFYRRVAVPYENQKLSENGDVFQHTTVKTTEEK